MQNALQNILSAIQSIENSININITKHDIQSDNNEHQNNENVDLITDIDLINEEND